MNNNFWVIIINYCLCVCTSSLSSKLKKDDSNFKMINYYFDYLSFITNLIERISLSKIFYQNQLSFDTAMIITINSFVVAFSSSVCIDFFPLFSRKCEMRK